MGTDVHVFLYDTRSSTRTYTERRAQGRAPQVRPAAARTSHIFCARSTTARTCRPPRHSHRRLPRGPTWFTCTLSKCSKCSKCSHTNTTRPLASLITGHSALAYSPRAPCPLITHKTSTRHGHTIVPTRMFRPEGLPPSCTLPALSETMLHPPPSVASTSALSSPHPPARPHRPTTLLVRRASAPCVCAVCLRRARLTPRRAASCSSGSVRVLRA